MAENITLTIRFREKEEYFNIQAYLPAIPRKDEYIEHGGKVYRVQDIKFKIATNSVLVYCVKN